MYKVYYQDQTIDFGPAGDSDRCAVYEPAQGEIIGIAKMLEKLGNNKCLHVRTQDPKASFDNFLSLFEEVDAAGGLVRNPQGDLLMIRRNGRWDLPKGHVEHGERMDIAAMREVEEETGIRGLECGDLITVTNHFYPYEDRWRMKRTWWYAMKGRCDDFTPQTEEGITEVAWVNPSDLETYAAGCFSSVRKVLSELFL